jgi:hypothetical protein
LGYELRGFRLSGAGHCLPTRWSNDGGREGTSRASLSFEAYVDLAAFSDIWPRWRVSVDHRKDSAEDHDDREDQKCREPVVFGLLQR